MTRVAIYARYSSDLQSAASIEDQVRLCELRAGGEGWQATKTYKDQAISGGSMLLRPGIQSLMQDAVAGRFDVVMAEALDRLSRDQEDIAAIFKRLSFAGVKLVTLSEGEISPLHIGFKGTMNALFLKDLADKTRRGLRGRVEQGRSGGGKSYGYDVVPSLEDRGCRTINPREAEVIRRIFSDYIAGQSPKSIAVALNAEGIPAPSGKGWGPSTIHGNRQRGTGILNNELYIGRMVWNRLRYVKDPDTGKRVSRMNPEEEWIAQDVPELRIVAQDLWDKVKARQGDYEHKGRDPLWKTNRPRHLFSYLIACGVCGGGCSMISKTHLGCSSARNKGTCANRLTIAREKLEAAVLTALQTHLMREDLCAAFCQEYIRQRNALRSEHNASRATAERELGQIKRQLDQMVDAIADGAPLDPIKDRMHALDARRKDLEARLSTTKEEVILFHPSMAARYHREVRNLITILNDPVAGGAAMLSLRGLIERIVLTPSEDRTRLVADLHGDLAGILSLATDRRKASISETRTIVDRASQEAMVAGVGFEPTTFRL